MEEPVAQQQLDDIQPASNTQQAADTGAASNGKQPDVPEDEKARVKQWLDKIKASEEFFEETFKRMKTSQQIVRDGHDKEWTAENYSVPILQRHINVSVASLYARNPVATAKRRKKLMFQLWDGNYQSLQQAMMAAQPQPQVDPNTGQPAVDAMGQPITAPGDPNAAALVQEVQAAHVQNVMMDKAGKTLEILFAYYMSQQAAGYKQQLKAAVRRTKTCCVGYIKLGFQRQLQPNPDVTSAIADVTSKISTMQRLMEEAADGEITQDSAEMNELKSLLADLQAAPELIVREGPVLGFPKANAIIVDKDCSHLKTLAGANWVAEKFPPMTPEKVKEIFKIDIGTNFTAYTSSDKADKKKSDVSLATVYEVQDKAAQQVFTICEGYPGFLKAPAEPDVKVSRFWTVFPLVFNEVEDDDTIYPNSDVWNARHMQREYNSVRQGLREHRIQNRPKYATPKGMLESEDRDKLSTGNSGALIELNALQAGQKVDDVIQPVKTIPIDPNLYEVNTVFADIERSIGSSQADLGSPASVTATQSSIVENGRSTMNSDNVDDLDDVLSELALSMGELMLLELDQATVVKIVGPGAVWPQAKPTRQQIAEDVFLEIKAGSSGRPNRGAELANMERGLPYLIQIPGVNPYPLGRRYGDLLDLDVEDIVIEGMPSITAMNAMAAKGFFGASPGGAPTGNAQTDPHAQGANGALNAPNPVANEPGPQAAHPAPAVPGAPGTGIAQGIEGTQQTPVPAPRYQAAKIPIGPQPAKGPGPVA